MKQRTLHSFLPKRSNEPRPKAALTQLATPQPGEISLRGRTLGAPSSPLSAIPPSFEGGNKHETSTPPSSDPIIVDEESEEPAKTLEGYAAEEDGEACGGWLRVE